MTVNIRNVFSRKSIGTLIRRVATGILRRVWRLRKAGDDERVHVFKVVERFYKTRTAEIAGVFRCEVLNVDERLDLGPDNNGGKGSAKVVPVNVYIGYHDETPSHKEVEVNYCEKTFFVPVVSADVDCSFLPMRAVVTKTFRNYNEETSRSPIAIASQIIRYPICPNVLKDSMGRAYCRSMVEGRILKKFVCCTPQEDDVCFQEIECPAKKIDWQCAKLERLFDFQIFTGRLKSSSDKFVAL